MPKRPRDTNQLAKMVLDMTTGQIPNDSFAGPSGKAKGGNARAAKLTPERRRDIAMEGVRARQRAQGVVRKLRPAIFPGSAPCRACRTRCGTVRGVARAFRASWEVRAINPTAAPPNPAERRMATYPEIARDLKRRHRMNVRTSWIAHVKELNGLPLRKTWNQTGPRKEPCPPSVRRVIEASMRRFGMIP